MYWVLPPTQLHFILGVLLRAIHNHIITIIQLLLRGGQYPRHISRTEVPYMVTPLLSLPSTKASPHRVQKGRERNLEIHFGIPKT